MANRFLRRTIKAGSVPQAEFLLTRALKTVESFIGLSRNIVLIPTEPMCQHVELVRVTYQRAVPSLVRVGSQRATPDLVRVTDERENVIKLVCERGTK